MSRIYRKNKKNIYVIPWYLRYICHLSISCVLFVGMLFLVNFPPLEKYVDKVKIAMYVCSSLFIALLFWKIFFIIQDVKKEKSVKKYLLQKQTERRITKSLLATMTVNKQYDTPYIRVPDVSVNINLPVNITIQIEKLVGMYDIDNLMEDVNASLVNRLSDYAVISRRVTDDGLYFLFFAEDVNIDKTFIPKGLEDLKMKKYHVKLQDDVIINMSTHPHFAIWGKTGSKKTTQLFSIILQLFINKVDVYFLDGKDEFSSFATFYDAKKIVSNTNDVFRLLDNLLVIIKQRQQLLAEEVKKRQQLGLRAIDIGLKHIVLVADEVGSILAQLESKEKKLMINKLIAIIQRARSVGVSVIVSTQDPSVDVLPQSIRNQFSFRLLLGSANADIQRMALGQSLINNEVEDFRGYYVLEGVTTEPTKFFVTDLHKYNLNNLEVFKEAYQF